MTVPRRLLAAEDLPQKALGSGGGDVEEGDRSCLGLKHLQPQPQGSPLTGSSQTQHAVVRDAPNPMPSTAVTFLERWNAKASPVRHAGDTVATVKDLSGHGAAAESALQAPGEEPLSPSWRSNNRARKFLVWPRR